MKICIYFNDVGNPPSEKITKGKLRGGISSAIKVVECIINNNQIGYCIRAGSLSADIILIIYKFTMAAKKITEVIVHPIVLLSIVDHYNRMAKGSIKRVIGVLLGISLIINFR